MAIAFDASVSGPAGGAGPHTTAMATSGSNVVAVTGVLTNGAGTPTVTYNGSSLSPFGARQQAGTSGYFVQLWALAIGAGSGSHNFVVTAGSGNTDMYPVHASYAGCAQTGIPDAVTAGNDATHANFAASLTTITNQCWVLGFTYDVAGTPHAAGASTTLRQNNSFTGCQFWDSNAARSTGSNALNFVVAAGDTAWMLIALAPDGGGGGGRGLFRTPPMNGMGVGGSFFRDPLAAPLQMVRRDRIFVPAWLGEAA